MKITLPANRVWNTFSLRNLSQRNKAELFSLRNVICDPRGIRTPDCSDESRESWATRRWGRRSLPYILSNNLFFQYTKA